MQWRIRDWCGLALVLAGVAFGLGFFFVPPQVLIPALLRDPDLSLPELLVGSWVAVIGIAVIVTGRRHGEDPGEPR